MENKQLGKPTEPSAEELHFIYSRLEHLSDPEILRETQDKRFPHRTGVFIRRCRKEYTAAKKVLQSQATGVPDSAAAGDNGRHLSDLLGLLDDSSMRLALLPAMFIPAKELYHDCPRSRSGNGNGYHQHSHSPAKADSEGALLCHTRERYLNVPHWSFQAAIPRIAIPCAWTRVREDSSKTRMLNESLRQHLSGSTVGDLWQDWESLAAQYVEACFNLWNQICADSLSLFELVVVWAHAPDEIQFSLDDGFSRTVYEKLTCSGFCDIYPCGAAEYSYTSPRVLLGKRAQPLLRYGSAVLLNASAKTKDMLRLDRTAEPTKERVVDPIIELHQHLISKYEGSSSRSETLRLQDEVGKLSERLSGEFGSLIEQRAMPGNCMICGGG